MKRTAGKITAAVLLLLLAAGAATQAQAQTCITPPSFLIPQVEAGRGVLALLGGSGPDSADIGSDVRGASWWQEVGELQNFSKETNR